jgi:hypothetical protein
LARSLLELGHDIAILAPQANPDIEVSGTRRLWAEFFAHGGSFVCFGCESG